MVIILSLPDSLLTFFTLTGKVLKLHCCDLVSAEAQGKTSIIDYYDANRTLLHTSVSHSLAQIARRVEELVLRPQKSIQTNKSNKSKTAFMRCHKSRMVNLMHCVDMRHAGHNGVAVCADGHSVEVGRTYKATLFAAWQQYHAQWQR
jgi:hypothetical protein